MSGRILYITGTNTGVGKTTLAAQLLRRCRERNIHVAALKPFSTGDRSDAQQLHALQTSALTLDEVNPFHFPDPLAPLLAARNIGKTIRLSDVLPSFERALKTELPLLVEGAGGLLSPLGENLSFAGIIKQFPSSVCIVAQNILGTLNSILLTAAQLENLPLSVVLMNPETPDQSTATNAAVIAELLPNAPVHAVPFLAKNAAIPATVLDPLIDWWTIPNRLQF